MKCLHLILFTCAISSMTSAQVLFNAIIEEDICQDVTLTLNSSAELSQDECLYSIDIDQVNPGMNTLEISSDIPALLHTTTLDMVLAMRAMDEGFESYGQALSADFNSDLVISTDDIINMARIIVGIDTEIPTKVKIATESQITQPVNSLELSSDQTSLTFEEGTIVDGEVNNVFLIIVGDLNN